FRLAPFALAAAAAEALAIHWWVPNHQTAETTRLFSRVLIVAIVFGLFVSLTQNFWRNSKLSLRQSPARLPGAALSNLLHWCVANAPILAAGVVVLSLWDVITLKLALLPLPYFPGPAAVLQS